MSKVENMSINANVTVGLRFGPDTVEALMEKGLRITHVCVTQSFEPLEPNTKVEYILVAKDGGRLVRSFQEVVELSMEAVHAKG